MSKKVLFLTAIVLVSSAHAVEADIVHSTWVGGEEGDWGQASNWDPARVPDNSSWRTFVVTIDSNSIGVDRVEVHLRQSRTINRLDTYCEVDLEQWGPGGPGHAELILEDVYGLVNHGYLEILEYDIKINGNVTNIAGAALSLVDMHIEGNLYNQAGATLEIGEEVHIESEFTVGGGNLENTGTILVVSPDGEFSAEGHFKNLGTILIYGGVCGADYEILDNNSTGLIRGFGILHGKQLLRNKGQIYAYGGSLAISCEGSLTNTGVLGNTPLSSLHIKLAEDVNNLGTIEVNIGGGVAFDCNLVNESNAVIELLGGSLAAQTITQSADTTFKGQGEIATANLVIETKGLIQLTGPTNIFGNVQIDPNATLEISDGQTLIKGHTNCNGTIHMKGGRIIPQGGLSGDCNIIWEPGTYTNVADFNLDGKINFKDFAYFADTWLWQTNWH